MRIRLKWLFCKQDEKISSTKNYRDAGVVSEWENMKSLVHGEYHLVFSR